VTDCSPGLWSRYISTKRRNTVYKVHWGSRGGWKWWHLLCGRWKEHKQSFIASMYDLCSDELHDCRTGAARMGRHVDIQHRLGPLVLWRCDRSNIHRSPQHEIVTVYDLFPTNQLNQQRTNPTYPPQNGKMVEESRRGSGFPVRS
jgi:hypothetical protein